MSFPSYENLASCQGLPWLVGWLAERKWVRAYHSSVLERGEAYAREGKVVEIGLGLLFHDCGQVEASVAGSRPRPYQVRLEFFRVGRGRQAFPFCEAYCTCPIGYECKHTAAVLVRLSEIASNSVGGPGSSSALSPELAGWLRSLRIPDSADEPRKRPSSSFLAYCLEMNWDNRLVLQLHRGSVSRGGVKIDGASANANPGKPAGYIKDEDLPLIVRFHKLRRSDWDPQVALHGKGVSEILLGALALDSLFHEVKRETSSYRQKRSVWERIRSGPDLAATLDWQIREDGSARPVLRLSGPEGGDVSGDPLLLPTRPVLYLDPMDHRCGTIVSDLPPEVLLGWSKGPVLNAEELEAASEGLEQLSAALPGPIKVETVRLPKSKPMPHLHIRPGDPRYPIGTAVGDLRFRYGEHPLVRPLAIGDSPEERWKEDGKRMILERDLKAEAAYGRELHECGFDVVENIFHGIPDDLMHTFIAEDPGEDPALAWVMFLEEDAPQLREEGWTIEVDQKVDLNLHVIEDFAAEIEAETDHGIEWFRLDLQIEIDGQRISLIPEIARQIALGLLEQDPKERPETLLFAVPPPGEGFVRFPTERMIELCQSIVHLLRGDDTEDGPLRLDRLAAAGVADDLKLDDSETVQALAALGRNLRNITGLPTVKPPRALRAELRPYQLEGFRWLRFLAENQLHGILADDMGLGKTVQTLAHLATDRKGATLPSLVVAPTSVVGNWESEVARFLPKFKVVVFHGPERHALLAKVPKADLVLTSYALLARDAEELVGRQWRTLVLDEAQYIKNPKTAAAKAACSLKAQHRVCLSGTPMENHLGEHWSLMRFLMPGFLGDEKSFNANLRRPIERDRDANAQQALNRRVSPLILRRTKDQVATDLPEKTEILHRVTLSPKELDLYESVRALMDKRVREAIRSRGLSQSQIIVLDALLKLRQVCCHPSLVKTPAAAKVKSAAKFSFLIDELLPALVEEGRRILLFSSFTSVLSLIEEELKSRGIGYLKLTGRTRHRAPLVKTFQEGETSVFLISLKAGGTGLNLTAADTVIHYDPWWNPSAENQATDRAHRIGQTKPVFVHKLICEGGIEERILELQAHKARLVEALLSEKANKLRLDESTLSALLAPIG